jgi:hypothetical protein
MTWDCASATFFLGCHECRYNPLSNRFNPHSYLAINSVSFSLWFRPEHQVKVLRSAQQFKTEICFILAHIGPPSGIIDMKFSKDTKRIQR